MGQIEKKKKKGRPTKADLAARCTTTTTTKVDPTSDTRRSLRRRSFRYNIIDYDEDYLDDDDDELFDQAFQVKPTNIIVSSKKVDDGVPAQHQDGDDVEDSDDDDDGDINGGNDIVRRREKKVKLVLKLNSEKTKKKGKKSKRGVTSRGESGPGRLGRVVRGGRGGGGDSDEEEGDGEGEEEEEEDEKVVVKKRRINGRRSEDYDDEDEDDNDDDGVIGKIIDKGRGGKREHRRGDYDVPGTPTNGNDEGPTPLPDKKQLELILDKLQKKDTYGVYAEPVDPEELPDYHEVIEQPMDFSTVRKKLANGDYTTLEEFESDVFLISANAMQYNASDTVYHRQARAIKELAEKKFQRIRNQIERWEKEPKSQVKPEPKSEPKSEAKSEPKSEQRDRPHSLVKKQMKKLFGRGTQEPVGSDFSSGATLGTTDAHNSCAADHAVNFERPSNNDGLVEGMSLLPDNNAEKAEEPQSGKSVIPKFGRRSFVVDENRRATYNVSNQPVEKTESIFTTFEGDKKQLIPVGLSAEYSYARSLARFAANLGPVGWRMASKRIEQVLPPGFKYGRGWIGEFEPLPTALLVFERRIDPFVSRMHDNVASDKSDILPEGRPPASRHLVNQPSSDGKIYPSFVSGGAKLPTVPVSIPQQQMSFSGAPVGPANMMLKRVESNCQSANDMKNIAMLQQHNRLRRDSVCPETLSVNKEELNSPSISDKKTDYASEKQLSHGVEMSRRKLERNTPSISNQKMDKVPQKQPPRCMEMPSSRPVESTSTGKNFLQAPPYKQPNANGGAPEGIPNGNRTNNFVDRNRVGSSSPGSNSGQLVGPAASFPQRQDEGLSDPVLVMKMLTEKAQRQQNGSAHANAPSQPRPSVPSPRGDAGGNAAAAAASAWMSVGAIGFRPPGQNPATSRSHISAESMYHGTRVFYPQAMPPRVESPVSAPMHYQPEMKGLPFQAFTPQPVKVSNEAQVQNRPVGFPQIATNDLSRFQVQPPWQGLSPHTQQKQKQDKLPPDLNVAFQSSVDSQQPDLALQL